MEIKNMNPPPCKNFRDRLPSGICLGDQYPGCTLCINCKTQEERDASVEKLWAEDAAAQATPAAKATVGQLELSL